MLMNDFDHDRDRELDRDIAMLREAHPGSTPAALARAKARVLTRVVPPRRGAWRAFVGTRLAVVATITAGALMSSGATALAIDGLSSSGSASTAQYGGVPGSGQSGVPGSGQSGVPGSGQSGVPGNAPSQAAPSPGKPSGQNAVTPEQQAAQATPSTSGTLPFTGLAVIPLLLIGLALLAAGLVARRAGARPDDDRRD